MQNFKYTARDLSGDLKEGLHRANNQHEALIWLREQGLIPVNVEPIAVGGKKIQSKRKRIKTADIASLCWQLATMLDGGLAITTAVELIAEDCENKRLQEILLKVSEGMHKGQPFSECLKQHSNVFNQLFISMITAGEAGGTLVKSLRRLAEFFDNRDKLLRKIKGAMAYPIFVVCFIIVIIIAIMTFIIPRFKSIFDSIGGKLPMFTRAFMGIYDVVAANAVYGIAVLVIVVAVLITYAKTERGHAKMSAMTLRIPLIGKILSQAFIAMFCQTMATLLGAGVSVIETLEILSTLTNNTTIKNAIDNTKSHIIQGSSISLSMAGTNFFPNMVVKMLQVGEESGSLTDVLDRTSEYYERKVDSAIQVMMSLLEPILIVTVGAIVGTVLIALYLPIFTMSDIQK